MDFGAYDVCPHVYIQYILVIRRGISQESLLLYIHECFTGIYTTRNIRTHIRGFEWRIFHNLTREDIDDFTDIKFVSCCSQILWCIIETSSGLLRKSSTIFVNFWKLFGSVRVTFGQVMENLRKIVKSAVISMSVHLLKRTLHAISKI